MRARWIWSIMAFVAGCDDVLFGRLPDAPLSQDGYAGVTEVIDTYCLGCHSDTPVGNQLDLQTDPYGTLVGGLSSDGTLPLVDPGAPENSLFYLKLVGEQPTGGPMPPGVELAPEATDIVRDWIADGAPQE